MKKLFILFTILSVAAPMGAWAEAPPSGEDSGWPPVAIRAVNPGYTDAEGVKNTNDFVELARLSGEAVDLAGVKVVYNNSVLYEFGAGEIFEGERILLRYKSSPGAEDSDVMYSANLAVAAGTVRVALGEEVWDEVCWGSAGCHDHFDKVATKTRSLVRCFDDGDVCGEGKHVYLSEYAPEFGGLSRSEAGDTGATASNCGRLQFSEILSYYVDDASEQFIELYNASDDTVSGCAVKYKNNTQAIGEVGPRQYALLRPLSFALTKNPSSKNTIEILDETSAPVVTWSYPNGQKKGTSYALVTPTDGDGAAWMVTYRKTPGEANIYQEFKDCPEGKVINEETGNCVNAPKSTEPAPCGEGKERNPETGRCRNIATTAGPAPCADGYERNPETNRCRKIVTNTGASLAPTPSSFSDRTVFIGLGALIATAVAGVSYAIFQFRHEIAGFWRKCVLRQKEVVALE
jgi:hypothetical protein